MEARSPATCLLSPPVPVLPSPLAAFPSLPLCCPASTSLLPLPPSYVFFLAHTPISLHCRPIVRLFPPSRPQQSCLVYYHSLFQHYRSLLYLTLYFSPLSRIFIPSPQYVLSPLHPQYLPQSLPYQCLLSLSCQCPPLLWSNTSSTPPFYTGLFFFPVLHLTPALLNSFLHTCLSSLYTSLSLLLLNFTQRLFSVTRLSFSYRKGLENLSAKGVFNGGET